MVYVILFNKPSFHQFKMLTYLLVFSLESFSVTFLPLNTLLHFHLIVKTSAPWRLTKKEERVLIRTTTSPVTSFENSCNRLKFRQPN